jgi:hypothetical protein
MGVADDPDGGLVAEGDLIDLFLHRAGVRVDKYHWGGHGIL